MRKFKYFLIDLCISFIIALLLNHVIVMKMKTDQQLEQDLQIKLSAQHVNKITSLLRGEHESIKSSQVKYPTHWESYAILRNEARGFAKEVIFGDSDDILEAFIGQYENSAIPGEGRPILLAGHNGTHFRLLREFEKGDRITMDTDYGSFVYEVSGMEVMSQYDFDSAVLDRPEEMLIMYCCYPFDSLDTDDRYFVYAKKINGLRIEEDGSWKE